MTARSVLVFIALALILQVTLGQDLDGCGIAKGCFSQSCTRNGPCTAFVTWETTASGRTKFSMQAQRDAGVAWVAFGLRPSTQSGGMAPADVYACTSSGVQRSENVNTPGLNSESRTIPTGAVTPESSTVDNGAINCVFTREASIEGDDSFYNISGDNAYYILLAVGNNINGDGSIAGNIHLDRWAMTEAIQLQSEFPIATHPPMETPMGTQMPGMDECGKTVGCYTPAACGDNCGASVMYARLEDGRVRFTLRGQKSGGIAWVAVGLRPSSTTSGMSPADVYACTRGSTQVERSENVAASGLNSETRTIPAGAVTLESRDVQDDVITCTFTRRATVTGADDKFYDISRGNKYYRLLAIGTGVNSDGTIQGNRHTDRWAADKEPVDLNDFDAASGGSQNIALAKAHASLMVIAWVGFASIGITMARYFKPMWPSSKLLGKKVWFTIHRICMVACVSCFVLGFILIFVYVKGFVNTAVKTTLAHAICGIIVTVLGIINPIMAIFRPHPGTPNRPIFNWAHWGVGTTAHLLAMVTVLLGFGYNAPLLAGLPNWYFFVAIGFVAFHIAYWIAFQVQDCMTKNKDHSNDIPMRSAGGTDSSQQLSSRDSDPPPGATAKSVLLSIYVLVVIVLAAVLVILIAIN